MLRVFGFFFKQKTAYEWRMSDWSSDVCSSDLWHAADGRGRAGDAGRQQPALRSLPSRPARPDRPDADVEAWAHEPSPLDQRRADGDLLSARRARNKARSEEHTSELQSLMRNSYAVFCVKKKKTQIYNTTDNHEYR